MAEFSEPNLVPDDALPSVEGAEAAPVVESSAPATMSRVEMARSLGFDVADDATDDAIDSSLREFQEHARFGYQFKQNPQQFAGYFQPQQPVQQVLPQQPAAPETDPFYWPEVDASMLAQCVRDEETGEIKGKNQFVPPHVVQAVAQALQKRAELHDKFSENPVKFTYERVKDTLLGEAREMLKKELAQQQYEAQRQAFEQEIGTKYYAQDASGNYLVNPQTGQYAASPWGEAYLQAIQGLQSHWDGDVLAMEQQAAQWADKIAGQATVAPVAPAQPVKTPVQVSQERKEAFLSGAVDPAINGNHGPSGAVYEPNTMTDGELENLFITRAKAEGLYSEVA